jgi:glyoxalase/bleomycin resistance protein/dioxygenase superfamily protein
MKAVSHIAVGVRDMDRSLHFYRDLLGLKVCLDTMENIGGFKTLFANPVKGNRRAVYLRFEDGPHASFIVLSQNPVEVPGDAIKLDQVGVHHSPFGSTICANRSRSSRPPAYRFSLPLWSTTRSPTASRPARRCLPAYSRTPMALWSSSISACLKARG